MNTQLKSKGVKKVKGIVASQSKQAQALRFMFVGGSATILQYGIYVVFVEAVGLSPVVSTLISYAISFIYNFFMTSRFTFQSKANAAKGIGFILSHLINLGLQTGLVAIFKGIVGETLALLPALAICVPVNFLLVRFVFTSDFMNKKTEKIQNT